MGLVFASVPFHAFFGVAVMSANSALGGDYYRSLALPWVPDVLRDQQLGGGLAWAAGEFPLLLVVVALLVQWSRQDERSARRDDRRADADGDAELEAYNAMLRRLATAEPPFVAQSDQNSSDPGHDDKAGSAPSTVQVRVDGAARETISAGQGDTTGSSDGSGKAVSGRPFVAPDDRDRDGE
ncbi:hypothetical protein BJF78_35670 [Pseudonocardia sp. CNS-139]|nr:hypothetical protein BJF78_35670 [Pseudonocardia sp. CNS-139]